MQLSIEPQLLRAQYLNTNILYDSMTIDVHACVCEPSLLRYEW